MNQSPLSVGVEQGGALLRLRLARPKANIVDAEMIAALHAAINQHDGVGACAFEEQLASLGPRNGRAQHGKCSGFIKVGLEGSEGGVGHGGLSQPQH